MFSDESRLTVTSDSDHQLLWRELGTSYEHKFVRERDRYGLDGMVCCSSRLFLLMDINTRPHRSVEVSATLQIENILLMQRPAYSPGLNPIEHDWDALGRRVAQRTIPPRTVQELKTALR
ncbi:uncharacterized protein TNCV_2237621 [Trichonephila clavipes]|nr:uncharacterized protein TNCV_2237621 [Trichonephila clavipes]